jgi:GNAT superfamily N-acetyltransferase
MSVFDLPMTARPGKDTIAGQDELGRTVYRTVTGERYTMPERTEMPAPTMGQRFENLGGLASRAYENLSVQGAIDAAKGIGEGIVSGIVQGFTAPGRALSGEPVSLGDVMATAGMSQVGAAPLRAPAGALRSGAMGGGRPPVTFDDVARAMDEAPLVSERNLGNENSNLIDKIVKDINGEVIERSYDKTFGNGDNAVIRSGDTDLQISVREDGNGIYLTNIASKKAGKQSEVKTGSGVGSKAIEALKRYSDETGKPLAVVGATGSAQKFYEKMGLKPKSVSTYTNEGYITSPSYGPEQQGTGFVYYPSRISESSAPRPPVRSVQDIEGTLQAKYPDVKLSISGSPERGYTLNKIDVPKDKRESGIGTAVMNDLVALADQQGAVLKLSPSGDFGGSVPRLKDFYERFGFVRNKGKNTDYAISESMYRSPAPISPSQLDQLVVGPQ